MEFYLPPVYSSKTVNQNYTNLEFIRSYQSLRVKPYLILDFNYNGKSEKIKIQSNPRTSRLAYISRKYTEDQDQNNVVMSSKFRTKQLTYMLNFSKVAINFKNNNFNENMLNECRLEILEFMKKYSKYKINTKHMDPRLKKLMAFN